MASKIPSRRAWVATERICNETSKKKEGEQSDSPDSEDEAYHSTRRALLGEPRRCYRFSIPMYQQPSDKVTYVITRRL